MKPDEKPDEKPDDIIQVTLKHKRTGEKIEKLIPRADLKDRLAAGKAKGWNVVSQTDTSIPAKNAAEQAKRDTAAKAAVLLEQRNAVKKEVGSGPRSFVSGIFDGLSMNWLDEAAGLSSPEAKQRMRANVKIQKSESPNAYAAGQMAGSVGQQALFALGLNRLGVRYPATPAGQMAYSGAEGALSAVGEAEDISLEQAPAIAATGLVTGVIGQVGGAALGRAGKGALKKLVGNTGLESAKEIEKRVASEVLANELAAMNRFAARRGQVTRDVLRKANRDKIPGETSAGKDAIDFGKQVDDNEKIAKEIVDAYQKNYPEPFSYTGAVGSYLGSEANDLQSYKNKITDSIISGNAAIDAVNKAAEGAIDVKAPNIPVQLTPAEEQRLVTQAAIDKIIELDKADAAAEKAIAEEAYRKRIMGPTPNRGGSPPTYRGGSPTYYD